MGTWEQTAYGAGPAGNLALWVLGWAGCAILVTCRRKSYVKNSSKNESFAKAEEECTS